MQFSLISGDAARQRSECVVVPVFSQRGLTDAGEALDRATRGQLSELLKHSPMDGTTAAAPLTLYGLKGVTAQRVVLAAFGARSKLDASTFLKSLRKAADAVLASGAASAALYLDEVEVESRDRYWKLRVSVETLSAQAYRFDEMKSRTERDRPPKLRRVQLAVADAGGAERAREALAHGQAIAAGVTTARTLGNRPGNVCTPEHLAEHARRLAKSHAKLTAKIIDEAEMRRLGMGALLAVARGSREAPKLIVLRYAGGHRDEKPVALVGKGVTFDSGGISIKPSASMDEMKFDMCGAASVLGTIEAVARMKLPLNVVALVPATENLPDGNAIKPGDIVTTMSGRTIEVLNTDAEGRLILCDALTYAERFEPQVIIDVATLTGACVVALGAHASGLWSNDDQLADALLEAGLYAADRAWRMPLWPEYDEALRSNFADVANVGGREAGAVTAASFLARFARDQRWAHLDIAGTAWKSGKAKGATGRPVPLLCQYLVTRAGAGR